MLEWLTREFGDGIDLCHEILVFELMFSVPLYVFEEGFGEWHVGEHEVHELFDCLFVVFDQGSPSHQRWVVGVDSVGLRGVGDDGRRVGLDVGEDYD